MADEPELDARALQAELAALSVQQFLVSAASSLASLAYAKLDRGDLEESRQAIDALGALVPQLQGEHAGDLALALARLQVAYADAASS